MKNQKCECLNDAVVRFTSVTGEQEKEHNLCVECALLWSLHALQPNPRTWSVKNIKRL